MHLYKTLHFFAKLIGEVV